MLGSYLLCLRYMNDAGNSQFYGVLLNQQNLHDLATLLCMPHICFDCWLAREVFL
uniref:Uncharacterized protein n=1 Tax=Arundo donax TaxID=35708 RepID=A0A0A9DZC5_ARUDO